MIDNNDKIEVSNKNPEEEQVSSRRKFLSYLTIPALAGIFGAGGAVSANEIFITSTADTNATCKCVQPETIESLYLLKTGVAADSAKLNGMTSTEIINETLTRAKAVLGGFNATANEGNTKYVNGIIYTYAGGVWRQIWPATYS